MNSIDAVDSTPIHDADATDDQPSRIRARDTVIVLLMLGVATVILLFLIAGDRQVSSMLSALSLPISGSNAASAVTGVLGLAVLSMILVVLRQGKLRRGAVAALHECEERLRLLETDAPLALFETDIAGRCLWTGKGWNSLSDLDETQSVGRFWFQAIDPIDRAATAIAWRERTVGNRPFHRECRVRGRTVIVRALPRRDATGMVVGYFGTMTDVTAIRDAQRTAAEIEARFRAVAEASPEGIWVVGRDGRTKAINRRMEAFLGLPETALLDRSVSEFVLDATRTEADDLIQGGHRTIDYPRRLRLRRSDGTTRVAHVIPRPVVDALGIRAGTLLNVVATPTSAPAVDDAPDHAPADGTTGATAALRAPAQVIRRVHCTETQAQSRFLSLMSHELRTPLNAILGFSEILASETFGTIGNPRYLEYANDIRMSGQRLLQLVEDLLELSTIEGGTFDITPVPLDLARMVEDVRTLVAHQLRDRRLDLEVEIRTPAFALHADERAVKHILFHLLSNAMTQARPGGHLCLRARQDADGGVTITMRDTGCSTPARDFEKNRNPFTGRDSGYREGQHSRLALPLAKALAELHGGVFTVENRPGVGTTVTVRFPPAREQAAPKAVAMGGTSRG